MPFCRECQREMPAEIVQTTGAVCQACGRAEERVRRRRRDGTVCAALSASTPRLAGAGCGEGDGRGSPEDHGPSRGVGRTRLVDRLRPAPGRA